MRCWDESVLQTHEHDLSDRRAFHQVTAGGKRGFGISGKSFRHREE